MQFIFTFAIIYSISTIIGQNMHMFTLEPKFVHIQSPITYTLLTLPYSFIANKNLYTSAKQSLTWLELLFCIFNQIILTGAIILQIVPSIPCEVVEITFGRRYSGFNITIDTYNQKIPLATVLALLATELLFLFGEIVIRAIRNAEFRKKIGMGTFVGTIALCLVFLAMLIFSIYLLF